MSRRGRPRANEVAARRAAVIEAATAELIECGYPRTTMLAVARRAGASKETLYNWFGDKRGLFAAVIEHQALGVTEAVTAAMASPGSPTEVLRRFGAGLLGLLLGDGSVALNRAAMADPELAAALLAGGRYTAGPIVEDYLTKAALEGELSIPDPQRAFEILYGLLVRDLQIRVLLGEDPPSSAAIEAQAAAAVDQFLDLHRS